MGAALRVLLVEPHPLLARALRRGLEEEGLAVTAAPAGAGADPLAPATACDLIILGPLPPRADDGRLVRRWRSQGFRVPVLVLTSDGHRAADDYLSVPFALEELLSRVRALARPAGVPQPT